MKTKTFGKLFFHSVGLRHSWVIDNLAPHVAIAFKRLFPKVDAYSTAIQISDSDETRADLLWFMSRYALETKHMDLLEEGARRVQDLIAERDTILDPDWTPPEDCGFRPGKAPYLYQAQAAAVAIKNGGLLLGDEVGLGKTVSALAALVGGAPLPAAVVVQTHLADQWKRKIEEFTTLSVHVINTTKPYRLPAADVYVFRYSNIGGWIDKLKNGMIKSVVYDEIQELRHGSDTDKGKSCAIVSARASFRMGLTATPIYNYGDEMFRVLQFINPALLGTEDEFYREWCKAGRIVKDPDALGSYLRESGWYIRRDEDDPSVDRAMPPPNVIKVRVDWDSGAVADEAELMRKLAQSVMSGPFNEAGQAARELDLKMRQMTGIAKARGVAAYVRLLLRGGSRRVILAGWHRDVYAIWLKELAQYEPVLYTGSENPRAKAFSVEQFTQGHSRVFILSLRSGAGLDGLQQFCNDVVIGEFDWSPQVHHQIIGRARRPGQTEQVNAHYLFTDEGSDPVLIETLGIKSDQSRGINDPGMAPKLIHNDESRLKRLARYVLEGKPLEAEPCALCGEPSTGHAQYILPIEEAAEVPPGPERDAYFGEDNQWFLCAEHVEAAQLASRTAISA